mgnify:CR=1 FL=1
MTRPTFFFFAIAVLSAACSTKDDTDTASVDVTVSGLTADGSDEASSNDESNTQGDDEQDLTSGSGDSDIDDSEEEEIVNEEEEPEEDVSEEDEGGLPTDTFWVRADRMPMLIPGGMPSTSLTSIVEVAKEGRVRDVELTIDIKHACSRNLMAGLESPSGTFVLLFDLSTLDGCGRGMYRTLLDDEASFSILRGKSPFTGPHQPNGLLSDFNGENSAGVWTLHIVDESLEISGELRNWALKLSVY